MKSEFLHIVSKNIQNIKFHENPSSGRRIVPCGRTDRHDEANSRFSQFANTPKNVFSPAIFTAIFDRLKPNGTICLLLYMSQHVTAQADESPSSLREGPCSTPGESMWGLVGQNGGSTGLFPGTPTFFFCKYHSTNALYPFTHPSPTLHNLSNSERYFSSVYGTTAPTGPGPYHYRGFTITLRHTTLGRTPLDE
jgi:hypothetical protein